MLQSICKHLPFVAQESLLSLTRMAVKSFSMSQIAWFNTMRDALSLRGLDMDELVRQCGQTFNALEMDVNALSDLMSCVWEMAVQRTGDASIGLTPPTHPLSAFGVIAQLLLSAQDLLDAARSMARFAALVSPTFAMDVVREGENCLVTFSIAGGRRPVPMQRFDFVAMVFLTGARWLTGKALVPHVLHMPFAQPADVGPWRRAYGCPIVFDAEAFRVEFLLRDMLQPLPTRDPAVADMCARLALQASVQTGGQFTVKVRQAVARILSKGDPHREQIAELLCVSERTLQRRLSEEGTSFAEIVDAHRRERAEQLLAQGRLSVSEMAFELGFSDPSNFYRACKRWFGLSPASFRSTS